VDEPTGEGEARQRRRITPRAWAIAGGTVVTVLVVVIGLLSFRLGDVTGAAAVPTPTATPTTSASPTVSDLFQRVGPSVVLIRTPKDLGTGVIATDDGSIVTANHVVDGASRISVTYADGSTTTATITSSDTKTDIATLTPAALPKTIVPATIGGTVAVGAPVVAIGNPLGLVDTVTSGVVSGLNRTGGTSETAATGLIQFDAAVDPGSSGGPLLDANGSVIGIVVSIADPGKDGAWAGIGFAVPIGAALGGGTDGSGPAAPHI
jgi:putative serine protease PepD